MIKNKDNKICEVFVNEFKKEISYGTDIVLDFIRCFESVLKNGTGSCYFEEKDKAYLFTIANRNIFITEYLIKDINVVHTIPIHRNLENLIKEFIRDVESDFNTWLNWFPVLDNRILEKRKIALLEGITFLKYEITKKEKNYKKEKELIEEFIY